MSSGFNSYKKYLKFFSVRFVQALIQSRLGDEVESKCLTYAEAQDWFNTKIDELGEISAYLKSHITVYPPFGTLTLEFLLYTPSGQCLPLEAWVLSATNTSEREDGCPLNELYHQMSTLLRSAIVSSRMTPMHRLYVKKQNQESFIIMYRVFQNDESSDMGKGKKVRRIGELVSQYGNVTLELHYRTSMHFEEPEFAPETPVEEDEETEIEDGEKTVVGASSPIRPVSECVPITDARKQRKASGSADSGGSSISREAVPRFILGQSTSSEDSRNSDGPHSYEDDHKPSLSDLRNHSFPFVNLLQSAYNPANGTKKNNSSTSLNTPAPVPEEEEHAEQAVEKVSESFRAAKIDEVVMEEDEEDEEEELPIDSMELSEDSYVHFNQLSEIGSAPSIGSELSDYLKQLKTAPDMFQFGELDIAHTDLKSELEKISSHTANFDQFISHINSVADE